MRLLQLDEPRRLRSRDCVHKFNFNRPTSKASVSWTLVWSSRWVCSSTCRFSRAAFVLLPEISERSALLALAGGFLIIGGVVEFRRLTLAPDRRARSDGSRTLRALTTTTALGLAALLVVLTKDFETLFPRSIVLHDSTRALLASDRIKKAYLGG